MDGSPVLRVLSASLTSARPSDRPCLGGLSGPTGLRLNRTDLPCSRKSFGYMPAVRTPEASRPTRRIAVPRCCLPRREIGSATSITFDFAALPCGSGLTIRSLAFRPATFLSTLRSGCYQTPRKTRYAAARLRLCRGRHPRRLNSTRLQGATLTEPYVKLSFHTALLAPDRPCCPL